MNPIPLKEYVPSPKATVTRADKGNTLVILPTQQYDSKIHNFIESNNFQITHTDPTKIYQASVRKTINTTEPCTVAHGPEVVAMRKWTLFLYVTF
jgi:hypothetical protein